MMSNIPFIAHAAYFYFVGEEDSCSTINIIGIEIPTVISPSVCVIGTVQPSNEEGGEL